MVVVGEGDRLVGEGRVAVERERGVPLVLRRAERRKTLRQLLQLVVRRRGRAEVAAGAQCAEDERPVDARGLRVGDELRRERVGEALRRGRRIGQRGVQPDDLPTGAFDLGRGRRVLLLAGDPAVQLR